MANAGQSAEGNILSQVRLVKRAVRAIRESEEKAATESKSSTAVGNQPDPATLLIVPALEQAPTVRERPSRPPANAALYRSLLRELRRLDRYEQRALARRNRAIRKLERLRA